MPIKEKREIESYQFNGDYFINTYLDGNKNHLLSELHDLYITSPEILTKECMSICLKNEEVGQFILRNTHKIFSR